MMDIQEILNIKPQLKRNKLYNKPLEEFIYKFIEELGLPVDFTLDLRGYSQTLYGCYMREEKRVVVYVLNKDRKTYVDLEEILSTSIHEVIHHFQYVHDKAFTRKYGVMHDPSFLKLEKKLLEKLDYYMEELETNGKSNHTKQQHVI